MARIEDNVKHTSFLELSLEDFEPVGVPGFSASDEKALVLAMYYVISSGVLNRAECVHRPVGACIFTEVPPGSELADVGYFKSVDEDMNAMWDIIEIGDSRYLFVIGFNNWQAVIGDASLDCKQSAGLPWLIDRSGLPWLNADVTIDSVKDVDLACPKRIKGLDCSIEHAESHALNAFIKLVEILGLEQPSRSCLCCTWVPCPNCLQILLDHQDLFGGSRIVSLTRARGDHDDEKNARLIKEMFTGTEEVAGVSRFHGTFVETRNKEPGYGYVYHDWDTMFEFYRKLLDIERTGSPLDDPEMRRLLMVALRIRIYEDLNDTDDPIESWERWRRFKELLD